MCGFHDAYHMVSPLLSNTPLTIWFIKPIYIVVYSLILLIVELVRKRKNKQQVAKI